MRVLRPFAAFAQWITWSALRPKLGLSVESVRREALRAVVVARTLIGPNATEGMRRGAIDAIVIPWADALAALGRACATSLILVTECAGRALDDAMAFMQGGVGGKKRVAREAVAVRWTSAAQAAEVAAGAGAQLCVDRAVSKVRAVELTEAIVQ